MLHTHKVLGSSLSDISDSLSGPVNAICFNTPQENFGEFAGYKCCITDYTGRMFFQIGANSTVLLVKFLSSRSTS